MASHPPPFPVEDNTDEAFFDELVSDDFDVGFKATTSPDYKGDPLIDGNESDDAKAIAELSIEDEGHKDEVLWEHQGQNWESQWENNHTKDHQEHNDEVQWDHQHISDGESSRTDELAAKLDTAEHMTQGGNEFETAKDLSNLPALSENSAGSGVPEVKEVDWSAFDTASSHNDTNGFGSYSDFFSEFAGDKDGNALGLAKNSSNHEQVYGSDNFNHSTNWQYNGEYNNGYAPQDGSNTYAHDLSMIQQWESQYPGWKYDPNTGQWYSVDDYNAGALANGQEYISDLNQASQMSNAAQTTATWNQLSQVSGETNGISSDWNQAPYDNNGYPSHMVFDPNYPGWYYDTIAMEWRSLESYYASAQSHDQDHGQMDQSTLESFNPSAQSTHFQGHSEPYSATSQSTAQVQSQMNHGTYDLNQGSIGSATSQSTAQVQSQMSHGMYDLNQGSIGSYYEPQNSGMQPAQVVGSRPVTKLYNGNIQNSNQYWQNASGSSPANQQNPASVTTPMSFNGPGKQLDSANHGVQGFHPKNPSLDQNKFSVPSTFDAGRNLMQRLNDSEINRNNQRELPNDYHSNQKTVSFSKPQVQNAQISYTPATGRSSAGRPPHALVTFGFGGKLVVMKQTNSAMNLSFGSQDPIGGTISILNFGEVLNGNVAASDQGIGPSSYFQSLCRTSLPGPLTGGSVTKDLNKWIDERIAHLESTYVGYGKVEGLSLLLSLLKIGCHYYGKLRSLYGTDAELKEGDAPDLAIAKLFASAKRNGPQFNQYGAAVQCLQYIPSDGQLRVTATEVQNLLVSGRKKEALQCAQDGQFWGLALILAAQLGNQFYADTVRKMALQHLSPGSPLRTLCLLIANQPADVFSEYNTSFSNVHGAPNMPQQTAQSGANGMLDDWEENLAVITANRTKDDELVLIHLGDCLWKERGNIIAAHICYLVAEANFEPYSDSARLCLVGADHLKFPRTFVSPEAIQRTEIYEYSKTLGNSQFVLLPFQPYKFVYALMLAEVGKMSEAAKYCQAVLKSLKNGRNPEVETLRQLVSSLDERIKGHQQGGFYANLAPKEFIGKLLKVFDSTAQSVVGGLPPPTVPTPGVPLQQHSYKDQYQVPVQRVATSQSTMAMSSLVPSQSMEPINEFDNNRTVKHARSASEPDFGRSPMKGEPETLKQEPPPVVQQEKPPPPSTASGGGLGLGFGTKLFQKTFGFVLKNRRQAKLGESNKFYYDEKLKRWVEEGAAPPAEEAAFPPPPPTTAFQNGASDYNLKTALQKESSPSKGNQEIKPPGPPDSNPGMPPLPPTTNQYSARGRMGVRSRYVDTFNKGGGNPTTAFQSPIVPSIKPATTAPNTRFFVPTPVSATENHPVDTPSDNAWENNTNTSSTSENFPSSPQSNSFNTPVTSSPASMQRYPSMNAIEKKPYSGSISADGRRTASWSGSFNQPFTPPPHTSDLKPLGEVMGSFTPSEHMVQYPAAREGDDLHEVEL